MLSLFCRDMYDLLLERVVEVSFVSALSTVLPDGTNANKEHNALLQSQLLHYSDVGEEYMYSQPSQQTVILLTANRVRKTLRLCESARYAESDAALYSLIHRSCYRAMSSAIKKEHENSTPRKVRKRSELGPVEHLRTWSINFIDLPTEELVLSGI